MKQDEDILRGCGKGGQYLIFWLHMHVYVRLKGYGLRERQSSNREHDRFYFICMLLFNSNFPAHLLRADVCMCVCVYVCMYVSLYVCIIIIINLIIIFINIIIIIIKCRYTESFIVFWGKKNF